jgi:uncharacterized membrane protein YdjX (TVP38/TMEM64 family)
MDEEHDMIKKILLVLLAIGAIFYWGADLVAILATGNMTALKELILRGGYLAPLISFALIIIQAFISPLPSVMIFIANGIIFGSWGGFLISWVGSLCSAVVCFGLIRYLGLNITAPPRILASMIKLIEEYQDQAVFVARVLPFVPFDLASYAFALTHVRLRTFLVGTALGQTPAILFYSLWGREQYAWYINLGGILVWVAVISGIYYLWQKVKKKKEKVENIS